MFDNVGSKIKGLVQVVFWLEFLAAFICGIVFMKNAGFFWGLLIMAGGFLTAWLSNLVLYSYGQLVDNTDKIREGINKLVKNETTVVPEKIKADTSVQNDTVVVPSETENGENILCPFCGELQPVGRNYCNICGTRLK